MAERGSRRTTPGGYRERVGYKEVYNKRLRFDVLATGEGKF